MSKKWEVLDFGDGPEVYQVDGNPIAKLIGHKPKRLADARLMAAAPELLDAAKLALDYFQKQNFSDGEAYSALINVIAKAEGDE